MSQQVPLPADHIGGWRMYRGRRGGPKWYQRYLEAWWIVTGRWSLHRAWQAGHDHGHVMEIQRTLNGGR